MKIIFFFDDFKIVIWYQSVDFIINDLIFGFFQFIFFDWIGYFFGGFFIFSNIFLIEFFQEVNGLKFVYLDSVVIFQKFVVVLEVLQIYYEFYNLNVYRGIYYLRQFFWFLMLMRVLEDFDKRLFELIVVLRLQMNLSWLGRRQFVLLMFLIVERLFLLGMLLKLLILLFIFGVFLTLNQEMRCVCVFLVFNVLFIC